jgi:hypothetical protein
LDHVVIILASRVAHAYAFDVERHVLHVPNVSELRALKKITTRPPAHAGGPRLPRQSGAERRARLEDGRCPVHGRAFDLHPQREISTVVGKCPRGGCDLLAVVEDGVWKLPMETAHLLEDNHLDDADALVTLARCLARAERRASEALRVAVRGELDEYKNEWLEAAADDAAEE